MTRASAMLVSTLGGLGLCLCEAYGFFGDSDNFLVGLISDSGDFGKFSLYLRIGFI